MRDEGLQAGHWVLLGSWRLGNDAFDTGVSDSASSFLIPHLSSLFSRGLDQGANSFALHGLLDVAFLAEIEDHDRHLVCRLLLEKKKVHDLEVLPHDILIA